MLTCGDNDMRAWLTLVLTTFCLALWFAGAFSLAHRLAGPITKEIALKYSIGISSSDLGKGSIPNRVVVTQEAAKMTD